MAATYPTPSGARQTSPQPTAVGYGPSMATVAVILAAGGSTRMGQPKALLPVGGRPLLVHHVDALSRRCERVLVVQGATSVQPVAPNEVEVITNPLWARTGPAESLKLALCRLAPDARVVVTPVDVPPVPLQALDALLAAGPPAVLCHRNRPGHPVLVEARAEALLHPGTLREVTAHAQQVETPWGGCLLNLNTPADWQAWLATPR